MIKRTKSMLSCINLHFQTLRESRGFLPIGKTKTKAQNKTKKHHQQNKIKTKKNKKSKNHRKK